MATLVLKEDDRFFFNEAAADKPCRFIEKFCAHREGKWAGKPFKLLPWQRDLVRSLFGWQRRVDGRRRFWELYLLTAKGAGKTPLLAAIGLYALLGDGEAGAHVVSMASSSEQARLTFDCAKAFILDSEHLSVHAEPMQHLIRSVQGGKWTTASGKPNGRSGSRPSCIIASEIHEWSGAAVESFNLLAANAMKRTQPLLLLDTNAGTSRSGFAWLQHERALRVLEGRSADETLLPHIFECPGSIEWTSEEAARAANPSIPAVVSFDQLRPQLSRAVEDESAESEYRRLYLSQWVQDKGAKWLDLEKWDACSVVPEIPADAALYVGMDLSQGDDLCAVIYVWAMPKMMAVQSHFWVPVETARKYEKQNAIPYLKWAAAGAITLLEETTINETVKARIAAFILETHKGRKIKAVCYDRYKADEVVAALEAAGILCVPVPQGYSLTPGCNELERRIKEGPASIAIESNPVLRAAAETVEVQSDNRGNYWPVKPGRKGKYAGKRAAKIDGVTALVTALTEARKHRFPAAKKQWAGRVSHVVSDDD